jgi:hypothetical protein
MNSICNLLFHAVLPVILTSSYVFAMHGKEDTSVVHIVRNVAWNDFITQIEFLRDDSPQDSLDKKCSSRVRLQKAYGDLETLRAEPSFREGQAKLER